MVKVKVKFFGVIRDVTGVPMTEVELEDGAVMTDLLAHLHRKFGQRFYDRVLDGAHGIRNYIRLFLNDEEIDAATLGTTRLSGGGSPEVVLYVMSAGTGG
ncbi:MAG: hypothetical protein Q7T05_04700 [Dehalococcoidia bacterium]|nr:hypothetical protein [Dehalococcoidia bacterium]